MKTVSKVALAAIISCMLAGSVAAADGDSFAVQGERLDFEPPAGWRLAWMEGEADGNYYVEYIPQDETIESWRGGYLLVRRFKYPAPEILQQIRDQKMNFAAILLQKFMEDAQKACPGKNAQMVQRINTFNGIPFAVSGGFCDAYGPAAPHGEGAFIAYAEGRDYFFQIQYGWRPATVEQRAMNLPWRLAPEKAAQYLNAMKKYTLCGGAGQAACKLSYAVKQ